MRALDILVVDDDHDLASGIADMLEAEGHRAALAGSGEAAIEVARDRAFDMVFLDVKLPGMNGIDALRELRKTQGRARVVLMTGYRIDNLLTVAVKTGGLAVLTRPATAPRMLEHLRDVGPGGIVLLLAVDGSLGARLEEFLTGQGLKVRLARTGEAAAESAAIAGLDVLILDLQRPISRILEVYLALQDLGPPVTVVMIASPLTNGKPIVNPLRSISVTGCLFKPFDPADLLQAVRDYAAVPAGPR
ncbi:MAG: response regulator [Proteobacteria bacterium]|nr:response regulator [Pseudomonadota bacterium]